MEASRDGLQQLGVGCGTRELAERNSEGFNEQSPNHARKGYGFRTYEYAEIALRHALDALRGPAAGSPRILLPRPLLD